MDLLKTMQATPEYQQLLDYLKVRKASPGTSDRFFIGSSTDSPARLLSDVDANMQDQYERAGTTQPQFTDAYKKLASVFTVPNAATTSLVSDSPALPAKPNGATQATEFMILLDLATRAMSKKR